MRRWRRLFQTPLALEAPARRVGTLEGASGPPPSDFEGSVDDHKFRPPEGKPWGLCVVCRFGQAAHLHSDPYVSDAPRARPQLEADVGEGAVPPLPDTGSWERHGDDA